MTTPEVIASSINAARKFVIHRQGESKLQPSYVERKLLRFSALNLFNRVREMVTLHSHLPGMGLNIDLEDGSRVHLAFNRIYTSPDHGIVTISIEGDESVLSLQNDPIGLSGGIVNKADLERSRVIVRTRSGIEKQLPPNSTSITQEDYERYTRILNEVKIHFPVPNVTKVLTDLDLKKT